MERPLKDFCLQVQPNRSPKLDMPTLLAACEALGREPFVRRFQINHGVDAGPYVNVMFATDDPSALWRAIAARLYGSPDFGAALAMASMAMCEGDDGWNDYLLVSHFDPSVPLSRID